MGRRLGDLVTVGRDRVEPSELGARLVDHYSLPAFDAQCCPERTPAESIRSTKFVVEPEAVLVSRLNPHIPRVWLPDVASGVLALGSTEFMVLSPRGDVGRDWLYFMLRSPQFQRALSSRVTGTSNSHQRVPVKDVLDIRVSDATSAAQATSVLAMAALDRKLRSNNRLLRSLGLRLGMLTSQVSRSRGTVALGAVADCIRGVSYRSADLVDSDMALVSLKCFSRDNQFRPAGLKAYAGRVSRRQVLGAGDVVVACTDLTQEAAIIGRVLCPPQTSQFSTLAPSQDCVLVRAQDVPADYLLAELGAVAFREHCRSRVTGTTVLHVSASALAEFSFAPPSAAERERLASDARHLLLLRDRLLGENALIDRALGSRLRETFSGLLVE